MIKLGKPRKLRKLQLEKTQINYCRAKKTSCFSWSAFYDGKIEPSRSLELIGQFFT